MTDTTSGASSRIAIKFGSASSSRSGETRKHPRAKPSSLGKRHRAHLLHESESESGSEDDESRGPTGRHEAITTYGPDGASADDDRRSSSRSRRRRRSDSPDDRGRHKRDSNARGRGYRDRREDRDLKEVDPADEDKPIKWGLTINSKPGQRNDEERADKSDDDGKKWRRKHEQQKPKTADEEAMEALLADPREGRRRLHDITSVALDRDPVAEDYKAIPVEDFGATLLKGFGWDGKMRGKVKDVAKHGNLTGLGAKNLKEAEELDAWSQKTAKESNGRSRPTRLDDYRREEEKKRQRRQERHGGSYRHEKERERERGRDRR